MNGVILAVATASALTACGGSSGDSPVEITATWEGGAQGAPTTSKASTPTTWSGKLCPATSISFDYQAHVSRWPELGRHLFGDAGGLIDRGVLL